VFCIAVVTVLTIRRASRTVVCPGSDWRLSLGVDEPVVEGEHYGRGPVP
jgi:hypothetical protein